MRYIAAILFMIIGLVEFVLRTGCMLVLCLSIVGLLPLSERTDPTELLEPEAFKLAERCLR